MLLVRDKKQILADWVRTERTQREWSQSDLADRIGKVRAVINKIEGASQETSLDTLASLAKAFGYPLTVVLDVLGYDVNLKNTDQWVEEMNYKLKLASPVLRPFLEKVLSSAIEEPQPATATKKAKSKA